MRISVRERYFKNLAAAFLAGDWNLASLHANTRQATGRPFRAVPSFVKRTIARFPARPTYEQLCSFLEADDRATRRHTPSQDEDDGRYPIRKMFFALPVMCSPPVAAGPVQLPQLATEAALAEWLGITPGRLRWYADVTGRNRKHPPGPLRSYRYRWVAKSRMRSRLLEIPVPALKRIQRKILDEIVAQIPLHESAHGFRAGRSITTNAAPHCGKPVVLRFDLRDFFPSVSAARVFRVFRTFGYPETVARLLTGLCTTRLPADIWGARPNPAVDGSDHSVWQRFAARHLPQGAPTSPALANLAAFRLDRRLAKLAARVGANYTRYADDLTLSGGEDLARKAKRFATFVAVIVLEEGFTLNYRKTRLMRRGERQQVAGVVVNAHPNVPRDEFDVLKAILTNCVRHGPASQNRDNRADLRAHLLGRISHVAVVNPARGRKLRLLFDRIEWAAMPTC